MKLIIKKVINLKARKLNNTMKKFITDVILLKVKNEDLRRIIRIKKNRRRRDKSLFNDLKINDEIKKVFFKFNKIQTIRDR